MNEPHMAPWWFPANDHPRDKATIDVRITVPRQHKVISNGSLVGRDLKGRLATTHWRSAEPMAPYLAFFAAGEFAVRKGSLDGRPYVAAVSRRLPASVRRASMKVMLQSAPLTAWLESQLGPYPFSSTGGVVTTLSPGFALETQTRPVYARGRPGRAAAGRARARAPVVRRLGVGRPLARHLAQRGLRDVHGVPVGGVGGRPLGRPVALRHLRRTPRQHRVLAAADRRPRVRPGLRQRRLPARRHGGPGAAQQDRRGRVLDTAAHLADGRAGGNGAVPDFVALAESVSGQDLGAFFDTWLHSTARPAKTAANGFTADQRCHCAGEQAGPRVSASSRSAAVNASRAALTPSQRSGSGSQLR